MDFRSVSLSLEKISSLYKNKILTTNFCANASLVSWNNYIPLINKRYSYLWEYQYLLNERQYSFLLSDNSFFQFFYEFDNAGAIKKAKLAYYPYPIISSSAKKIEDLFAIYELLGLDISDESWIEMLRESDSDIRIGRTSHFRMDFDLKADSHDKSHLQYSALNELRISSKVVLNPFVFIHSVFSAIDCGKNETEWFRNLIATRSYMTVLDILRRENHNLVVDTSNIFRVGLSV